MLLGKLEISDTVVSITMSISKLIEGFAVSSSFFSFLAYRGISKKGVTHLVNFK